MSEVNSIEQLTLIFGYLVPGLIIVYMRAQFLTGRVGPHKEALLSYFTLSVIYLTAINATTTLVTGDPAPVSAQTRYWLPIMLGGAVLFGTFVGLNARLGLLRGLLRRCGLHLPHVMDTAWDWRFSQFPVTLMTVTMKDGSKVSGWCGRESFAGSDPANRDLYIEQIYDVDENGSWHLKTPGKGIYIGGNEIRTIEFIPTEVGEK